MKAAGASPTVVLLVDVPDDVLVVRVWSRQTCLVAKCVPSCSATLMWLMVSCTALQSKCVNRRIDPESGKIYDISDGVDLPEGVDAATLVQREDDQEDKVRARLDAFAKERDAVCSVFNDIVHTVDGSQCVLQVLLTWSQFIWIALSHDKRFSRALFACFSVQGTRCSVRRN